MGRYGSSGCYPVQERKCWGRFLLACMLTCEFASMKGEGWGQARNPFNNEVLQHLNMTHMLNDALYQHSLKRRLCHI